MSPVFALQLVFFACILLHVKAETKSDFLSARANLLSLEHGLKTGGDLALDDAEEAVNKVLMALKVQELDSALGSGSFPPSQHFFHAKSAIEQSQVFKFIRKMPKGAALHLHDDSLADLTWLVKNATYRPDCFMCQNRQGALQFHFSSSWPKRDPNCNWRRVNNTRIETGNATKFDAELVANMSLVREDPKVAYPTQDAVWKAFEGALTVANGLIFYSPVFKAYFYEALREFYEDNVQYIELRGLLPKIYELDGTTHDEAWVVAAYKEVTEQFVKDHPDFSGAKFIYSSIRAFNESDIAKDVAKAVKLRAMFPSFFAGYDLVGQEDPGHPLVYFLDTLLQPSQQNPPVNLPYFFHAGETDWEGMDVDDNILDAILLNTSRIGHGFALTKHPVAMELARKKGIPIEVCPISNQVLKLVDDLRDHPVSFLLAQGHPVVISADDPSVWGARGLSYDFYQAFMAMGGVDADLAFLKKLALDSLRYSSMSEDEKSKAMELFQQKWKSFLHDVLSNGI
ncbi:adenosine deaminase 2-like [Branchiostoma floridae x Branchiostoma belcheri]